MQRIKYVFLSLLDEKQKFKFGVLMTGHLTLFWACFSVIFSRFLQQKEWVLERLSMSSRLL